MPIIDPSGLFRGERLAACSDQAKLYWPYFYCASNGCARLELSYRSIISKIFTNFSKPPEPSEIWQMFREYEKAYLVILYEVSGVWWAQFETSEKWLPKYKTAKDRQSPAPPLDLVDKHREGYIAWKKRNSFSYESFQKTSEDSQKFPLGVVVVDGVVEGDKALELSLSSAEPTQGQKKKPKALVDENSTERGLKLVDFKNIWNENREHLARVDVLGSRAGKLRTRIREGLTLERFMEAVVCCRDKPFLRGDGDTGWKASFDWLIDNDTNLERAINEDWLVKGNGNAKISGGAGSQPMGVLTSTMQRRQRQRAADQNGHLPAGQDGRSDAGTVHAVPRAAGPARVPGRDDDHFPF